MSKLKRFFSYFFPVSRRFFITEITTVKQLVNKKNAALELISKEQQQIHTELLQNLITQQSNQLELIQSIVTQQQNQKHQLESVEALQQTINERLHTNNSQQDYANTLSNHLTKIQDQNEKLLRKASEAVWATIFNNTISNSSWLHNKSFSPGRWAAGYLFLYVMYRVLNEMKPQRILELGLGQTTRMIGQYTAIHNSVEHTIIENDLSWIDFFSNDFKLSERSKFIQLDLEMSTFKDVDNVRMYNGFQQALNGNKYDFISIDAPLASDMKKYGRVDILSILPDCLSENFVIMVDDYERIGEINTVKEIEAILKNKGIPYKKGRYSGEKDLAIICSDNMKFLTSL